MHQPAIKVTDLTVQRGSFRLNIPELQLYPGTILCIAGPNGSGKSSMLSSIVGLIKPTQGDIAIQGVPVTHNLRATKASIGYMPDDEGWLIPELTGREYLRLIGGIYLAAGNDASIQSRIQTLGDLLQFSQLDLPLSRLSHGNKKKVQLIAGLMHQPPVIIIDELRNGLDPLAIMTAEHIVRNEAKRGACIIAATHDLWWAERIADEILLLGNGRPVLHKTTRYIIKNYGSVEKAFMHFMGLGAQ